MKFKDEDEVIVDIMRVDELKKEYRYKALALIIILIGGGLAILTISEDENRIDSLFVHIGFIMAISGVALIAICIIRPGLLKIGETHYEKTSICTEREFKEFKELK